VVVDDEVLVVVEVVVGTVVLLVDNVEVEVLVVDEVVVTIVVVVVDTVVLVVGKLVVTVELVTVVVGAVEVVVVELVDVVGTVVVLEDVVVVVVGCPDGQASSPRLDRWMSIAQMRPTRCAPGPTSTPPAGADSCAATRDFDPTRTFPPTSMIDTPPASCPIAVPGAARSSRAIESMVAPPAVSTAPLRPTVSEQNSYRPAPRIKVPPTPTLTSRYTPGSSDRERLRPTAMESPAQLEVDAVHEAPSTGIESSDADPRIVTFRLCRIVLARTSSTLEAGPS